MCMSVCMHVCDQRCLFNGYIYPIICQSYFSMAVLQTSQMSLGGLDLALLVLMKSKLAINLRMIS